LNTGFTGAEEKDTPLSRDATPAEKLRGTNVWVPTQGRLRPVTGHIPGWGGCRRGSLPLLGSGVSPWKIFENSGDYYAYQWASGRVGLYLSKQQAFQGLNSSNISTILT